MIDQKKWRVLVDIAKRADSLADVANDIGWTAVADDLCQWVDEEREVRKAQEIGTSD